MDFVRNFDFVTIDDEKPFLLKKTKKYDLKPFRNNPDPFIVIIISREFGRNTYAYGWSILRFLFTEILILKYLTLKSIFRLFFFVTNQYTCYETFEKG